MIRAARAFLQPSARVRPRATSGLLITVILMCVVARAAATIVSDETVETLLESARSMKPADRAWAMRRGGSSSFAGVSALSPMMQAGLGDPSPTVREASAYSLAEWGSDPAIDALLTQTLEDEESAVRRAAAYAIG